MYVVNTGRIMENLLTFDKMEFDNFTIHGYVHALLEDVVEVFNSKDFDQAYDRIGHLTTLLGNNTAVETIYIELLNDLKKYARASGWDPRLKMKICEEKNVKNRDGIIHQVLLIMDLDATVEELSFAPESSVSLGELVSDNPSQDELSKLVQ
ncbi:hypothetical protein FDJ25_gp057 [Vibrio phage Aphrodite1]|uniref:Uncharacterized protein n=1 Tax=Vibrio phage Aphrodite1 TaxID=2070057 RepID=A0A2I7QI29_9CAUD|nr:hypothetical protein FDJ25_gp057 [Vibrio phage Aphrodite1]AUR81055.1 hypothetical protein Aphrodite1_0146 [Vibrio phage Aphrodite1]